MSKKKHSLIDVLKTHIQMYYKSDVKDGCVAEEAIKIMREQQLKIIELESKNNVLINKKSELKRIIRKLAKERKQFKEQITFLAGCCYFAQYKRLPVDSPFGDKYIFEAPHKWQFKDLEKQLWEINLKKE